VRVICRGLWFCGSQREAIHLKPYLHLPFVDLPIIYSLQAPYLLISVTTFQLASQVPAVSTLLEGRLQSRKRCAEVLDSSRSTMAKLNVATLEGMEGEYQGRSALI
jgi:hypothetical protein